MTESSVPTTPSPAAAASAASSTAPLLSAAAIFAANDIPYDTVDVPEWGGRVRVRGLTSDEWDAIEDSIVKVEGKQQVMDYSAFRAKLAVAGIVDAAGARLFTDADVKKLGAKSAAALKRVAGRIQQLSKVSDDAVEELVGNSSAGRSGGS